MSRMYSKCSLSQGTWHWRDEARSTSAPAKPVLAKSEENQLSSGMSAMSRDHLTGLFLPGLQSDDEHHLLGPGRDAEMHKQSSQPFQKLEFMTALRH